MSTPPSVSPTTRRHSSTTVHPVHLYPISVGRIVIVWFLRVALSRLLAVPTGLLVQAMAGWTVRFASGR